MRRIGLAAVLAMALLATACGDDDDDDASDDSEETTTTESDSDGGGSADRQAYVDAIATIFEDSPLDADGRTCIAEAYVDVAGLEQLQEKLTPEEIEEQPDASPADLGLELDQADGEALYAAFDGCGGARAFFMGSMTRDVDPSVADCLDQGVSDDVLQAFAIVAITQPSETAQTAPEFQAISAVYQACSAQGTGTTQP